MTVSIRKDPERAMGLYRERGYHIEEGLVPDEVVDRVLAMALERPTAKEGVFRPIPMPHRDHPLFLQLMRYPPIVSVVERLVGGTASGIGGEFFYMKPGTPGFVKHQDNAYVQAPPDAFISAWTAMSDVDAENGSLVFYPGSHRLGALAMQERPHIPDPGQNPGAQAAECLMPVDLPSMPVVANRGTTVFFHSQLVHASNPNRSTRFRYSFLATYIRKGEPFRPGRLQQRQEVDLS